VDPIDIVEIAVLAIELLAVTILTIGVAFTFARAVYQLVRRREWSAVYRSAREGLGRFLLLGLEVLIAADIIATVALDLTLGNVASLGLIVLIRTFLSWAIEIETEGRWPWQTATPTATP
jgi:uncharacterized membrane protein